jgi:hypothetical protein
MPLSAASETLRYSVNWPTGLSLGEASLSADNLDPQSAAKRSLEFRLEASIPGFAVVDEVKSLVSAAFCAENVEKRLQHGAKKSLETLRFDPAQNKMERRTERGGSSHMPVGTCPKDALGFIYFLRNEVRQGRLPGPGPVYFGAAYQLTIKYVGVENLTIGAAREAADKFVIAIQGPASQNSLELFLAKDAVRTPLLFRVPLVLGAFSMELLR